MTRPKTGTSWSNKQLSKILIDNNTEMPINTSSPLKLKEGYELSIKSINGNETKAILELKKNGQSVDTEIVQPTIDNANVRDQTYYYKTTIGDTADIIQIAVHFKNIFHGYNKDSAIIDGIFQISDTPTTLTLWSALRQDVHQECGRNRHDHRHGQ